MTRSTLARSLWCALVVIPLLPVVAVANDNCADAFVAIIDTYTGDTMTATNDGVADCGISDTSPDVWYEFTAAEDGVLTVASCGSDYDTVLSLHSACPGTIANQLVCNDDSCGLQSSVTTAVITGDVIYIRIAGFADATGDYTIVLTGPAGVPAGGSPPGTEFMRGDINVDGVFDISDPVSLLAVLFIVGTPPPVCDDAGDLNDDGVLDISDAVSALAVLFIPGTPSPDAPFGACGEDPTDDLLACVEFALCP